MSGERTADAIYGKSLKQAGRPYVEMLRDWVACGRLADPYKELLVKESKFIDRGFWRWTIQTSIGKDGTRYVSIFFRFWNNESECQRSCEMVRYLLDHQYGTKQVCRHRGLWGVVYLTEPGQLETQDLTRWKISERHPRMWDRSDARSNMRQ